MGHINAFLPVALALKNEFECRVVFCTKASEFARSIVKQTGFEYIEAPLNAMLQSSQPAIGHADILFKASSFSDEINLHTTLRNWLNIFDHVQPDLIIADYAPVAMLAAKIAYIPHIAYDTGFFSPPLDRAFPLFANELKNGEKRLRTIEATITKTTNNAIKKISSSYRVDRFQELFTASAYIFNNHPLLDVYQRSSREHFVGPLLDVTRTETKSEQSTNNSIRVFCYLSGMFTKINETLSSLSDASLESIIYVSGTPARTLTSLARPNLHILTEPAVMEDILPKVDVVLCHGGSGTINLTLAYGKRLAILPMFTEQAMNARCLEDLGLGVRVHNATDVNKSIKTIANNKNFHIHAHSFNLSAPKNNPVSVSKKIINIIKNGNATTQSRNFPKKRKSNVFSPIDMEIFFLCNNAESENECSKHLKQIAPQTRCIDNFNSVRDGYLATLNVATSGHFITVDANVLVDPSFFRTRELLPVNASSSSWSWPSINEINGLVSTLAGLRVWDREHLESLNEKEHKTFEFEEQSLLGKAWIQQYAKPIGLTFHNATSYSAFCGGYKQVWTLTRAPNGEPISIHQLWNIRGGRTMRRLAVCLTVGIDSPNGCWALYGSRLSVLHAYTANLNRTKYIDNLTLSEVWRKEVNEFITSPVNMDNLINIQIPLETIIILLERLRIEIEKLFGGNVIENWTAERSNTFKQELHRRHLELPLFHPMKNS